MSTRRGARSRARVLALSLPRQMNASFAPIARADIDCLDCVHFPTRKLSKGDVKFSLVICRFAPPRGFAAAQEVLQRCGVRSHVMSMRS